MIDLKHGDQTADLDKRFSGADSPFIVNECELWEFRPKKAIDFLRHPKSHPDERLIILAGLTAWMIAPSGIINTRKPNAPRTAAQSFIHEAMVLTAMELLAGAFEDARHTGYLLGEGSIELAMCEQALATFCCQIFLALGGFEAILRVGSIQEFEQKLESQFAPVRHVIRMVSVLEKQTQSGSDSTWRLEKAAQTASGDLGDQFTKEGNRVPRGLGAGALKNHWRSLKQSAPLIFAASNIDDGNFLKLLSRDPSLELVMQYEHPKNLGWITEWLSKAEEAAALLCKLKMIDTWPPPDQIFRGPKTTIG